MKKTKEIKQINPLDELCLSVKKLVLENDYISSKKLIYKAMEDFPHAPHPHNLLGIVLEKTGNHLLAMRHFRAAWALDPSYAPANHNLQIYGTFFSGNGCSFYENDVPLNVSHFSANGEELRKERRVIKFH